MSNHRSAGPAAIILLALAGASCIGTDGKPRPVTPEDVEAARRIACAADPRLCLPEATATPTPAPTARPTAEPSPTAQATATPPSGLDTPTPVPATPTPTPTTAPTATPTAAPSVPPPTPTPSPIPSCVPRAFCSGPPVSLAQPGGCRRFLVPLEFEGEYENPSHLPLCTVKSSNDQEPVRTSWREGYGLARQGMVLRNVNGAWMQYNAGRDSCTDACGRYFPGCGDSVYADPNYPDAAYGWGGYSEPLWCSATPEPTAMPAGPTPTPAPRGGSCMGSVIATVAFLGFNRPGLPEGVVAGADARLDVTWREAQFPGDQRGQPVDKSSGPDHCEPERDPVIWDVQTPGGVGQHFFNDGYGLNLSNLQPGSYRIHVDRNPNARYRNGDPVKLVDWGHNGSVSDTLEFEIQ